MSEKLNPTTNGQPQRPDSRHRSQVLLGALTLDSTNNRSVVAAKRGRKPNSKKKNRCPGQVSECHNFVYIACATRRTSEEAEQCRQASLPCCDPLETCDATGMLECVFGL